MMRYLLIALLALPAATLAQASFFDDFDELDRNRWFVSDGWRNGEWMNCDWSEEAVALRHGRLVLGLRDGPAGRICGEIQSIGQFGHGTYEIALRTPRGSGTNAAFFTYIGPVHGRSHEEIDIEILLRDTGRVTFNTWRDGQQSQGGRATLDAPSDARFHRMAFHWTPEAITWYLDDRAVHRAEAPLPEAGQKIYASLWGSDTFVNWMGPFDPAALPMELEIDWIAFTALGEGCQFDASLLCSEGAP